MNARKAARLGISAIASFPAIEPYPQKPGSRDAHHPEPGVRATRDGVKARRLARLGVMCDSALDPFTSHGTTGDPHVYVARLLVRDPVKQALAQAAAAATLISPLRHDGRGVGGDPDALDQSGHERVPDPLLHRQVRVRLLRPSGTRSARRPIFGQGDKRTTRWTPPPANTDEALPRCARPLE